MIGTWLCNLGYHKKNKRVAFGSRTAFGYEIMYPISKRESHTLYYFECARCGERVPGRV